MLSAKLLLAAANFDVGLEVPKQSKRILVLDSSNAYWTEFATKAIIVVSAAIATIIALVIVVVIRREFLVLEVQRASTCRRAHFLQSLSSQQLSR